jgi:Derlin-2/3
MLAYAYTYSQENPNRQVSFFIINFQAKYLPLAMLFIAFIMDGPTSALHQATGIVAAHLYDFLNRIWPAFGGGSQEPWIKTPQFIANAFGANQPSVRHTGYGTGYRPGQQQQRTGAIPVGGNTAAGAGEGGWSSGSAWNSRGPGRRLGE